MTQPLSFDHLQAMLRQHTTDLPDLRKSSPNTRYTVQGAALGAFGIFFMQSPSFLDYQRQLNQRQGHDNAQTLFGVDPIPCDNQVRKLLDPIAPSSFNPVFFEVFEHLEQQHWLNPWRVLDHQLLVSLDGTQYFSSKKLHCQNCLTRQLANGQTLYYHTAITPVIVSPIASNGRDIRNAVLQNLMPLLWYGLVDQAIAYLKSLPESEIKNEDERIHLVQYLAKNHPMIPVYAVRRELGLRNSSNRGEKANDLLVAERQKHNGMSWSPSGSVALASVTALKHNREYHKWFRERKIAFTLAS